MAALDVDGLKRRATAFFKGFSASQLVIIGLLTAVAVGGGMALLSWASTPTYAVLLAGMDAKDASAVTAKLTSDGVAYQLQNGGATVLVTSDKVDAERLAVAGAGLPAGQTSGGWQTFDSLGLTSSSFQQQVAYQRAMETTLAGTLQGLSGVRTATVHLSIPEKKLFSEQQDPTRASVLLATSGTLSSAQVEAVTHLVASAVPGLAPGDVSVSDSSGALLTGSTTGTADRTTTARAAYESKLDAQVTSMFDTLLGPGHAIVRVAAEINTSDRTIDSETYDKTKTAVLGSSQTKESYASSPGGSSTSGVLTASPGPSASASPGAGGYSKTSTDVTNGVSRTVEHQVVQPGDVKRLTVAVAVDRGVPNAPSPAEISSLVSNAVGLDPTRGDTIAVTTPAFPQVAPTTAATAAGNGGATSQLGALAPKVLGGLLLLLVGLGFLRTIRRGTTTELSAAQITAAVEGAGGRKGVAAAGARAALPSGAVPAPRGEDSRELLEALDDPDEIAGMLRGWLATTSDR